MLGILAFGSLVTDPGEEIAAATRDRQEVETPFRVEFARSSRRHGGGPTLVPVAEGGGPVRATALILDDAVGEAEAANLLWRRESGNVGTGRPYRPPADPGPDHVLIESLRDHDGFAALLYADFPAVGKIADPSPAGLAELAIGSVAAAPPGRDGISYLIRAKASGIATPLMGQYEAEILRLAVAPTLQVALRFLQDLPAYQEQVRKALRDRRFTWRTVCGICRQTGLTGGQVGLVLRSLGDRVVTSAARERDGADLYRLAGRPSRSMTDRLFGLLDWIGPRRGWG